MVKRVSVVHTMAGNIGGKAFLIQNCPDLTLDDVTVNGAGKNAFHLKNAHGIVRNCTLDGIAGLGSSGAGVMVQSCSGGDLHFYNTIVQNFGQEVSISDIESPFVPDGIGGIYFADSNPILYGMTIRDNKPYGIGVWDNSEPQFTGSCNSLNSFIFMNGNEAVEGHELDGFRQVMVGNMIGDEFAIPSVKHSRITYSLPGPVTAEKDVTLVYYHPLLEQEVDYPSLDFRYNWWGCQTGRTRPSEAYYDHPDLEENILVRESLDDVLSDDYIKWEGEWDFCENQDKMKLLADGEFEEALLAFDEAVNAEPTAPEAPQNARYALAALYQDSQSAEAVNSLAATYTTAYVGLPVADAVQVWLPNIPQALGEIDEAIAQYQLLLATAETSSDSIVIEMRIAYLEDLLEDNGNAGKSALTLAEKLAALRNRLSGGAPASSFPELPASFALHPAYPNPFNASAVIRYDLPKSQDVSLRVFDILGREVAKLATGRQQAGYHTVVFDGSQLASGVYFYALSSPEYHAVKKMVMVK